MQKTKKKIYKNGLRVITIPMKDNPTVTVLFLVGAGSDYEDKNINGISHFLEHMSFKGTIKRPSSKIIAHELDALGCQYNAFTGNEFTGYYAKGNAKKFKQIFDIISDIYLNSTFPEKEIEKEKGVIVEEINMYEDLPQELVQDLFQKVLYSDQPAGCSTLGTKENIYKMTRNDFVNYKKNYYSTKNTVVVIAGNINEKEIYQEINKSFKNISVSSTKKKIKTKNIQNKPKVLLRYKNTDQTHFILGVRSFSLFDKRNAKIILLASILGAGMSSRLFNKLREEMGVAYYVASKNMTFLDRGFFEIFAGVNNERVYEVIKEILKECKDLINNKVTEEELKKVKSLIVGNLKMSLESSDSVANFYSEQELLRDEVKSLDEKIKEINKVTINDIKQMAKLIFKERNLNLAVIGPYKNTKKFEKILKF